jgi:hypothetical protein
VCWRSTDAPEFLRVHYTNKPVKGNHVAHRDHKLAQRNPCFPILNSVTYHSWHCQQVASRLAKHGISCGGDLWRLDATQRRFIQTNDGQGCRCAARERGQAPQGLIDVDPITCDDANHVKDNLHGGGCSETQGIMVERNNWIGYFFLWRILIGEILRGPEDQIGCSLVSRQDAV